MSAGALAGSHWLLLDVPSAPDATWRLQEQFAGVQAEVLFDDTELHGLGEHSPLLLDLRRAGGLVSLCHLDPQAWPGLVLISSASAEQLLAHLRRMLTVTLGLHHKALLNYYNPHTASYFFDGCDPQELSCWLGPISQVRWFGGTWADRAIGSLGWQQLTNPGLPVTALENEHSLSDRQQRQLQQCLLERHAWRWSRAIGRDYHLLWKRFQEGLGLGFTEQALLDDWLWLRLQHPDARPVPKLEGRSPREYLDQLRRAWQGGPG
ncbi:MULTISPECIES: DUF4123 domain-containing protein [Pseudomonas]|uniref:DUF4123 domain-containing protein n=1 Tax=Pseudomonas fluorescens TaxID=294 RepID=A0A0D0P6R7_PSEFL|nr:MULTISPECIES: DUF4123 domain-containing protein [Pseudomonas]KIQ56482.1 hypothetical protein RL74_25810 [Pseudomonas fluorescens]BBP63086.1 hypothetical protein PHLH5_06270 [Pseudomonas sp. Cab53]